MSLLEDVFLENEANEAQDLERVIEGEEFDERPRSRSDSENNSEREDEAEEEKKRVDPASTKTKRVIKNPRFILNPARLTGPRGIHVIPEHFKDFKFKGKGHEKEDLDIVLKKLEHWAYRLYPKFKFEDCLKKIETLGKKRPVMVHLHKIRSDQYMSEETVVQRDSSDDEAPNEAASEAPPEDEFDKLLQKQIELARSTPAPNSVKNTTDTAVKENRSIIMPKATSSPSISEEQRERILKSRKLAEERRLARIKNASQTMKISQNLENIANTPSKSNNTAFPQNNIVNENDKTNSLTENDTTRSFDDFENTPSNRNKATSNDNGIHEVISLNDENHEEKVRKARTNVIDSSDEDDIVLMNDSIRADVHKVDNDKNHTNGIKGGPEPNDVLRMGGNVSLEIDRKSNDDPDNDSSSDEDNIVLMNESIKVDVHKVDNKNHRNDKDVGPKQTDEHTIHDDVVLENNGHANNDDENDSSSDQDDIVLMNESVRADIHNADIDKYDTNYTKQGPKPTVGNTLNNDVVLEKARNTEENREKGTDTFLDQDNNSEIDIATIITKNNANRHEFPNIDVDMSSEKSVQISNIQEMEHKVEQANIIENEDLVERVPENTVVNNVDIELMDVEFDDDF